MHIHFLSSERGRFSRNGRQEGLTAHHSQTGHAGIVGGAAGGGSFNGVIVGNASRGSGSFGDGVRVVDSVGMVMNVIVMGQGIDGVIVRRGRRS